MARRVVGFLEYGKALDHLDHLVSLCTPEELAAIDVIIAGRDEFTIFNKLPKKCHEKSDIKLLLWRKK